MPQKGQRRTYDPLAQKFPSPAAKSEYFRQIGQKGHEGRITLSPEEAERLRRAYAYIISLAPKLEKPSTDQPDESAA
jgi:hypothetical protein